MFSTAHRRLVQHRPLGTAQDLRRQVLADALSRQRLQRTAQSAKVVEQLARFGLRRQQVLDLGLLVRRQFGVEIGAEQFAEQFVWTWIGHG